MNGEMLFLAWAPPSHSGRSQLLGDKLGIEVLAVHYFRLRSWLAPVKYVLQAARTWLELVKRRPRVIWVQDPPIFASLAVWAYCLLSRARFIIDSHTDALLASWWQWSIPLHRFLSRRAICTIVTNDYLREIVESWGATAFVLADVPTEFRYRTYPLSNGFNIVMVSSFSYDEPLLRVFQVAQRLPEVQFYVTGNLKLANDSILGQASGNIHMTGFLPYEDYYGLIAAADAVMVLTTEDHTLQWGACEAISMGKPVITSDWPFLTAYFHKGTIHVDNSVEGIYQGVVRMQHDWARLSSEAIELRAERRLEWDQKRGALLKMIQESFNKR